MPPDRPDTPTAEASSVVRERVEAGRASARSALDAWEKGTLVAAGLSKVHDEVVSELYERMDGTPPVCLVATGGWGRSELCPFSDIDLLILTPEPHVESVGGLAQELLYPLWDAGIRVGHAVRAPRQVAALAAEDLPTATALLDMRVVAGDGSLADALGAEVRHAIAPGGSTAGFIGKLAAERERRHARFGVSLYQLEPNLKQGIGALRDLSTGLWAVQARFGANATEHLLSTGVVSRRQLHVLEEARDFLLALRAEVQFEANRATDQLTFELQETIGPRWFPDAAPPPGKVQSAVAPAVEQMMSLYYLHGREVVQLTDHLLEAATSVRGRRPRITNIDGGFLLFNGKLSVRDGKRFRSRPAEILRLFRVAQELDAPVYWHTRETVSQLLSQEPELLTGESSAARLLLDALCDPRDAKRPSLLEQMHRVGIINALIPEFAPCTGRVQHDLYHVYTVDQHQLYAVAMLKRLARGDLAVEHPLAATAFSEAGNVVPLYLGTLLHDVGKPLGKGHSEKGARIALEVGRRLGLAEGAARRAAFLVHEHLTMSHLSQRRDLSDPRVIERFAKRVGDTETLAQLYLLTLCDAAMTAPGNLTEWKAELLSQLYLSTRAFLGGAQGQAQRDPLQMAEGVRRRVISTMTEQAGRAWLPSFVEKLDAHFVATLSHRQLVRQLKVVENWRGAGGALETGVTCFPMKATAEFALVCRDTPGLLSYVAGVLAAHGIRIEGAFVSTCDVDDDGPLALDLFVVSLESGKPLLKSDARWLRVNEDLQAVLAAKDGMAVVDALLAKRATRSKLKPRVTPDVETHVRLLNDASENFSVLEVSTKDRVGALHDITRAVSEQGLDIRLAKVSTEGERISDAFYLVDAEGKKLRDPKAREVLHEAVRRAAKGDD